MSLDVHLNIHNLADCIKHPELRNARSITIEVDGKQLDQTSSPSPGPEPWEVIYKQGKASTRQLWAHLGALMNELGSFTELESLSFVVSVHGGNGFWIPRGLIASLLRALPRSCLSVEVDTNGSDYGEEGGEHLCEVIRGVLPRLRHLRMGLSTVCHAVFGTGRVPVEQEDGQGLYASSYVPATAADLQTVLLECTAGSIHTTSRLCGSYAENSIHGQFREGQEAVPVLGRCMQLMLQQCPRLERVWIVDANVADNDDPTVYRTINRRDIIEDTVCCMPWRQVTMDMDSMLLRSPAGDFVSTLIGHRTYIEDGTWKRSSEGYRLPGAVYAERGSVAVEPVLLTAEAWRAAHPRKQCGLWHNEKVTGQQLLDADPKKGALGRVIVKERTPEGWKREEAGVLLLPFHT